MHAHLHFGEMCGEMMGLCGLSSWDAPTPVQCIALCPLSRRLSGKRSIVIAIVIVGGTSPPPPHHIHTPGRHDGSRSFVPLLSPGLCLGTTASRHGGCGARSVRAVRRHQERGHAPGPAAGDPGVRHPCGRREGVFRRASAPRHCVVQVAGTVL